MIVEDQEPYICKEKNMEKKLKKINGSSVIVNTDHIIDLAYTTDGRIIIRTDVLEKMSINNKVSGLQGYRTYYIYKTIEVKESDNPILDGLETQKVKSENKGVKSRFLNTRFISTKENGVIDTSILSYCDQKDNSFIKMYTLKFQEL